MKEKQLPPLRILALETENYKRLRAVAITPKGDIVQITGANDNGKTSLLDSIFAALDHVRVDAPMPIRAGEKKARILVTLGERKAELVVERTFTDKGSYLKVESPDGAQFRSPQKVLDAMLGALSFDPLEFSRMKPREQYDALKQTVKLEVDVEALEGQNRGDYDRRTEINREIRAKKASAEATIVPADPGERADEKVLLDELQSAAQRNADIERVRLGRQNVLRKAQDRRDEADRLVARAKAMRTEADVLDGQAAEAHASADQLVANASGPEALALPESINLDAARQRLEQAQVCNRAVSEREQALERRRQAFAEVDRLEAKEKELTQAIEAREQAKASAIAAAKMPVEGLGFGDGVVTYKDVPFVQASSAVKTRVSLGIAMAANPKIRVIRIQDGSLLDDRSMEIIAQMARERDYQVWIEKVDTSGKVGIYIEDGSVKAIDGDLVTKEAKK